MRAYSAAGEEALRARHLLKDWASEGYITDAQYQQTEQETVCDFRHINIFLRLVLFLFTLIIVGASVALFFVVVVPSSARDHAGFLFLIFAAVCYWGAEAAVSQARLYRYGIEEALAVCSVAFLCAGIGFFRSVKVDGAEDLIAATGAMASLWIWQRFGLAYAFLAAMIFAAWLASSWTLSLWAQHAAVAAIYAAGLIIMLPIRSRHRMTYLNQYYSIAEALLWLGSYAAINLQLSSFKNFHNVGEFPRPFYWATWVITWCLPPLVLTLGFLRKDRLVIAVGAITAAVTLATNKPYLGWERHTWDPILLGGLLIGVALFLRSRLDGARGGVLHGFTARRLSGKDKKLLNAGSSLLGAITPQPIQGDNTGARFGGGDSGGGGASSDF